MPRFRARDWRFWLTEHQESLGVPLAIIGLLLLIVLIGWSIRPVGPVIESQGRIMGLGFYEYKAGSIGTASIEVDGTIVRIELPTRLGCQVGDTIQMRSRTTRWGRIYNAAYIPHPCARAPFRN